MSRNRPQKRGGLRFLGTAFGRPEVRHPTAAASDPAPARPSLAVVSYYSTPGSPRGERVSRVLPHLQQTWEVELIDGPGGSSQSHNNSGLAGRLAQIASRLIVDRFEPWSLCRFWEWRPEVAGAWLVGVPLSPLSRAFVRLHRSRVPFVVDLGDLESDSPLRKGLGHRRRLAIERKLLRCAVGVVVTTQSQAQTVAAIVPRKTPVLVRPNGYDVCDVPIATPSDPQAHLRLAHLGLLYSLRVDAVPFLERLAEQGQWMGVVLNQFGPVKHRALEGLPKSVMLNLSPTLPRADAAKAALGSDALLVVDNMSGRSLPSKAIEYLGIPRPRIALVASCDSELARFARNQKGWLVVHWNDREPAAKVAEFLGKSWTPESLEPPIEHSWESVSIEIADFVTSTLSTASGLSS